MSGHRARIVRIEPESTPLRLLRWVTPAGAQPLGYIRRGDDEGRMLRLRSGALVIQLPGGAIGTLDQRKAQAMLDAEDVT
ncbi:MAG: hypothetical protein ACOY45_15705 [Pseudomonadota bacterium]